MVDVITEQPVVPTIGRLVVIGLGLIGGSFAKGVRESGLCREVVGVDLSAASRELAVELGVVDRCETDLAAACVGADVIQLAVPILSMETLLGKLAALDLGQATLTDVGSAKGNVVRAAREAFGPRLPRFVPGHPIAGSERSGVEAANAKLFRRHKVILTPLEETDPQALQKVDALWRALGADVEHMQVERHDEVLAATSHLPHLLAFGLVDSLARRNENLEIFRYAAGGFRDFTRIAGSDPVMWHDIFLANRDAVLRTLDTYRSDLDALRDAVDAKDGSHLLEIFTRARMAREHFGRILARRAHVEPVGPADIVFQAGPGAPWVGTLELTEAEQNLQAALVVAAAIMPGSDVRLQGVVASGALQALIDVLSLMGADVRLLGGQAAEQFDVHVRSAPLRGIEVTEQQAVSVAEGLPLLFVAAACAEGRTLLQGSRGTWAREADRIQVMADGLRTLGGKCQLAPSGIIIDGGALGGGEVHAHGDPQIAVAFSLAAQRAVAAVRIHDCANVATSFPGFLGVCEQVGIRVIEEGKS